MTFRFFFAGVASVLVTLVAYTPAPAADAGASRIVSAGGSLTEIVYALGEQDRLVGIDTTSLYPPHALAELPNVGYLRHLSPEGVLALAPTLILLEADAGPPTTLEVLEAAGIDIVRVDTPETVQGAIAKIRRVAEVFSAEARGEEVVAGLEADMRCAEAVVADQVRRPRVLFVLSHQGERLLVAGRDTSAEAIIRLAGGENVVNEFIGYKPINHEAVVEADPEVIVTMVTSQHNLSADALFANAALRQTSAAARGHHVAIDGLYLLGFGPRLGQAVRELAKAISTPPAEPTN